jgi:hypothetical protein
MNSMTSGVALPLDSTSPRTSQHATCRIHGVTLSTRGLPRRATGVIKFVTDGRDDQSLRKKLTSPVLLRALPRRETWVVAVVGSLVASRYQSWFVPTLSSLPGKCGERHGTASPRR